MRPLAPTLKTSTAPCDTQRAELPHQISLPNVSLEIVTDIDVATFDYILGDVFHSSDLI